MSRRLATLLLILAALIASAAGGVPRAASNASSDRLSSKDRIEAFEEVWRTVYEKYYDPSFKGIDWRAVHERYRPLVDRATSDEEFYTLFKRMVGELRDAHTRFHAPDERRERERLQAVSAGLSIFEVEGKPVVVNVEHDSDAARAGVDEGMIVLAIDGRSVAERLAEARARVAGSSSDRAVKLRLYRMLLDGEPGTTVRLRLARADGSEIDVALTRRIGPDAAVG